jgi:hypothetical protein
MISDRQQAVQKAQQQQQQQLLHQTCSSHALGLQTPAASTEGLASWQSRGAPPAAVAALQPAALLDGGDAWGRLPSQQLRLSSDGAASAPHSGVCISSNSSSSTLNATQLSGSAANPRQGSPNMCPHQTVQVSTEPLVFGQPGWKKQQQARPPRQQRQQQERARSSSRLHESHLEPSVFIESF